LGAGSAQGKEGMHVFFEKRSKKLLRLRRSTPPWDGLQPTTPTMPAVQSSKSFLVLFFKKELLSSLTRLPCGSPPAMWFCYAVHHVKIAREARPKACAPTILRR
jgi:hypothetical protein